MCWNNADILGFLFRHYDPIVQRYVVFDDGSTDDSLEILRANPKVEVRPAVLTSDPQSKWLSSVPIAETCWKESRGVADWVILTEIDEHLYHPDLTGYLGKCKTRGITIVPALGYQMLCATFPSADQLLCEAVTTGAPWQKMNKLSIFSPDAVETLNYTPGRHRASPTGRIVAPRCDRVLLLHYRYLDFERTYRRNQAAAARLRETELARKWGSRYHWSREQLREDWQRFERDLVDISDPALEPWKSHLARRWWEKYRLRSPS
jgi:hypothetical protein